MARISYMLTLAVIYPISWLPFPLLYGVSDVLYVIMFKLLGYRKKVVYGNLKRAFPDKSAQERHTIAKRFYRHLTDLLVESFKGFTISKKALMDRMDFTNPEVVNQYYEQGRHVILIGSHYNNWEYLPPILSIHLKHTVMGIYKPLSNQHFDKRVQKNRSRFGALVLVPMKQVKQLFAQYQDRPMAMAFLSDQSPSRNAKPYWMDFLGVPTPMLFGAEYYAKQYDAVVLYGRTERKGRGRYTFTFEVITETPKETPKGFITEAHSRLLEQQILEDPAYWLWSHKRWKLVKE